MLDVCSQLWNKCANFKGLVDEPDIRLKTDKGCQQGPSSLSTGSNHTGVSLGLGTQKWRDPFIFIIWRRQEIIMTLTYQKLGFSFKYFKTILLHFDIHSTNILFLKSENICFVSSAFGSTFFLSFIKMDSRKALRLGLTLPRGLQCDSTCARSLGSFYRQEESGGQRVRQS